MIDTAKNTVVATVAVGNVPFNVAVTPDGNHAYVANAGSSNISVIDTSTTNAGSNTVSVIATATNTVVGTPIQVEGLCRHPGWETCLRRECYL